MRVKVKICGITTPEGVRTASAQGVDAIGFVFAKSPRRVTVEQAIELAKELPPFVTRVAVTRNPEHDHLVHILDEFNPDVLQTEPNHNALQAMVKTNTTLLPVLHDDDTLDQQVEDLEGASVQINAVLLEGPGRGGRGVSPDWTRAAKLARRIPLVLAGGLNPNNVGSAIRHVRPYAVDVSSGVEEILGTKNPDLITQFMTSVHEANSAQRTTGVS